MSFPDFNYSTSAQRGSSIPPDIQSADVGTGQGAPGKIASVFSTAVQQGTANPPERHSINAKVFTDTRLSKIQCKAIVSNFDKAMAFLLNLTGRYSIITMNEEQYLLNKSSIKKTINKKTAQDWVAALKDPKIQKTQDLEDFRDYQRIKRALNPESLEKIRQVFKETKNDLLEIEVTKKTKKSSATITRKIVVQREGDRILSLVLIGKELGKGGFSIVTKGKDLIEGRKIAIKNFNPEQLKDSQIQKTDPNYQTVCKNFITNSYSKTFSNHFIEVLNQQLGTTPEKSWNQLKPEQKAALFAKANWLMEGINEKALLTELQGIPGIQEPPKVVSVQNQQNVEQNQIGFMMGICYDGDGWNQEVANLPARHKLRAFQDLVSGLTVMHEKEIHHGDIKPENLLYKKEEGQIKLVLSDFGGARKVEDGKVAISHTEGYYPPRMYQEDIADHWKYTDFYALATTFVTILSPKTMETVSDIIRFSESLTKQPKFNETEKRCLLAVYDILKITQSPDQYENSMKEFIEAFKNLPPLRLAENV